MIELPLRLIRPLFEPLGVFGRWVRHWWQPRELRATERRPGIFDPLGRSLGGPRPLEESRAIMGQQNLMRVLGEYARANPGVHIDPQNPEATYRQLLSDPRFQDWLRRYHAGIGGVRDLSGGRRGPPSGHG